MLDINNQIADPSSHSKATVIDSLRGLLDTGDEVDKCNASRALGTIGAIEAIDDLVLKLSDEDIDVCIDATEALGKLNAQQVVPQLIDSLKNDPDGELKTAVVKALGEIKSPASIPILQEIAEHRPEDMIIDSNEDWDDWWDMQRQAVIALGKMKAESAIGVLQNLLTSDDVLDIEHEILKSLVSIGGRGEQMVMDQLKSGSALTRRRAAHELSYSSSPESLKALASAFTDGSEDVRLSALQALVDRKATKYLSAIDLLKRDRSEKVRQAALLASNQLSLLLQSETESPNAAAVLDAHLLKDPDPMVRSTYLQSLQSFDAKLDDGLLKDQIFAALNDKNEMVILAAIPLLLKLVETELAESRLIELIPRPKLSRPILVSCINTLAQLSRWNINISRALTRVINHADSTIRLTTLQALMTLEKNFDDVDIDQNLNTTPIDIINETLNGRVVLEIEVASIVAGSASDDCQSEAGKATADKEIDDKEIDDRDAGSDRSEEAISTLESIMQDNLRVQESLKQMNNLPLPAPESDPSMDEFHDLVQNNIVRSEWLFEQKEEVTVARDVQRLAAKILSGLPTHLNDEKSTRVINSLLTALNSTDIKLATHAAESLSQIAIDNPAVPGIEYAYGGLITQFHCEQWDLKQACMKALAAIRNRAAIPILMTALDHKRSALRVQAIQAITQLQLEGDEIVKNAHVQELPPTLIEWLMTLIDLLDDNEAGVRYAAVNNLKRCLMADEIKQQPALVDSTIEKIITTVLNNPGGRTTDIARVLKAVAPIQATEKLIQRLKQLPGSFQRRFAIEILEEMYRSTVDHSASIH